MLLLEQKAVVSLLVQQLGKPFTLASEEKDILLGFRQRMEMWACHNTEEQDG